MRKGPSDAGDPNDTLAGLRALPRPVQDAAIAAATLRRARAAFLRAHAHPPSFVERVGGLYLRAEPILVASIAVVYLGWACETVASLWR
jgi:hypothetical protein